MLRGIVIKAYSSYYYVQNGERVTACSLRGRFKKERFSLFVGDEVEYTIVGADKGVIEHILPRRSLLKRPAVANVEQVIVTFAAANPDINTSLIDRFLVLAELSKLDSLLCINKIDLIDFLDIDPIISRYKAIGYPVLPVSAKLGIGINELQQKLYDKITVLAGPSGAGKSTILNAVQPGLELVTGEVSEKIGRGKHTTRFAELLSLTGGGFVVDTPGFSLTDFSGIQETELSACFPEIEAVAVECKFTSCLHLKEPQCAVKQAVTEGKIAPERYNSYLDILTEIRENKRSF